MACSVTVELSGYWTRSGSRSTRPAPTTLTVSGTNTEAKCAVTLLLPPVIVTVTETLGPEASPLQFTNVKPTAGVSVSVTTVPLRYVGRSGSRVTEPPPSTVTFSVYSFLLNAARYVRLRPGPAKRVNGFIVPVVSSNQPLKWNSAFVGTAVSRTWLPEGARCPVPKKRSTRPGPLTSRRTV